MTDIDAPAENVAAPLDGVGPYQEIKIIDEQGAVVPVGAGHSCVVELFGHAGIGTTKSVRGKPSTVQGWLHSGDLAEMDAEGYVQIVGRIKDMIIRGGENVYPREIEEFLYTHPDILEAQVFGIPDEKYGEIVCAWVQQRDGADLSAADIKAYCADQITHFKVPSIVRFVGEFPMTVTGKIQKFKMRDATVAELAGNAS